MAKAPTLSLPERYPFSNRTYNFASIAVDKRFRRLWVLFFCSGTTSIQTLNPRPPPHIFTRCFLSQCSSPWNPLLCWTKSLRAQCRPCMADTSLLRACTVCADCFRWPSQQAHRYRVLFISFSETYARSLGWCANQIGMHKQFFYWDL